MIIIICFISTNIFYKEISRSIMPVKAVRNNNIQFDSVNKLKS